MSLYTQEYANLSDTNKNRNVYSTYGNNVARYTCNNPIQTPSDLTNAMNTYKKIYNIYTTNTGTNTIPKDSIRKEDCIQQCPNDIIQSTTANRNNIFYASPNSKQMGQLYVSDLDVYLDDCGAQIRNYDQSHDPKSYTADLNYVKRFVDVSYNEMQTTRNDLDNKMNEILGYNQNSILYEKQNQLDSSVYSNLLWTVMVTSLIYYVFTKI